MSALLHLKSIFDAYHSECEDVLGVFERARSALLSGREMRIYDDFPVIPRIYVRKDGSLRAVKMMSVARYERYSKRFVARRLTGQQLMTAIDLVFHGAIFKKCRSNMVLIEGVDNALYTMYSHLKTACELSHTLASDPAANSAKERMQMYLSLCGYYINDFRKLLTEAARYLVRQPENCTFLHKVLAQLGPACFKELEEELESVQKAVSNRLFEVPDAMPYDHDTQHLCGFSFDLWDDRVICLAPMRGSAANIPYSGMFYSADQILGLIDFVSSGELSGGQNKGLTMRPLPSHCFSGRLFELCLELNFSASRPGKEPLIWAAEEIAELYRDVSLAKVLLSKHCGVSYE